MYFFQKLKLNRLQKKLKQFYQQKQQGQNHVPQEIALHLELANFYQKHLYDKDVPRAAIFLRESYRAAASLGDTNSLYLLSKILVEEARFWQEMQHSIYNSNIYQRMIDQLYEEAFAYLNTAKEKDHILATRQLGLMHVNGWGVPANQKKGFQLIVDSINQEKSWDRATEIFKELGLNRPEFFASLMSMKKEIAK